MMCNKSILQYALLLSIVETILVIFFIGNISVVIPFFLGVALLQLSFFDHFLIRKETIFHPMPFILMVLLFFWYVAPIFSIYTADFLINPARNINWDFWGYYTLWVNFFMTLLFFAGKSIGYKKYTNYNIYAFKSKKNIFYWGVFFLTLSLIFQLYVFNSFGGVLGYINAWGEERSQFDGLGKVFIIAEAFPIILSLAFFAFLFKNNNLLKYIILFLIIFLIVKILFGGLRGSRSNTVWGVFWIVGIIHIAFYKIKKYQFFIIILCFSTFMSTYALYKSYGVDAFSGEYSLEDTNRFEGNPYISMLINDFSRSSLNTYQTSQYYEGSNYSIKYGETYLQSLSMIVPPLKYFFNGYNKDAAGFELYHDVKIDPRVDDYYNSRVFGLYGEGILNFGPIFATLLIFLYGFVVSRINSYSLSLNPNDARLFFVPFITNMCMVFMISDSNNIIFFVIKNALVVWIMFMLITEKRKI